MKPKLLRVMTQLDNLFTSGQSVATLLKKERGRALVQVLGFFAELLQVSVRWKTLKAMVSSSHWQGQFY